MGSYTPQKLVQKKIPVRFNTIIVVQHNSALLSNMWNKRKGSTTKTQINFLQLLEMLGKFDPTTKRNLYASWRYNDDIHSPAFEDKYFRLWRRRWKHERKKILDYTSHLSPTRNVWYFVTLQWSKRGGVHNDSKQNWTPSASSAGYIGSLLHFCLYESQTRKANGVYISHEKGLIIHVCSCLSYATIWIWYYKVWHTIHLFGIPTIMHTTDSTHPICCFKEHTEGDYKVMLCTKPRSNTR